MMYSWIGYAFYYATIIAGDRIAQQDDDRFHRNKPMLRTTGELVWYLLVCHSYIFLNDIRINLRVFSNLIRHTVQER